MRFSDFQVIKRRSSAFEHALDNALEDVRIEAKMSELYPGAETLFHRAHEETVQSLTKELHVAGKDLIPLYVLTHAERTVLGRQWMKPLEDIVRNKLITTFGHIMADGVKKLSETVSEAKSTEDVRSIRKKIMRLLRNLADSTNSPKESSVSSQSETGTGEAFCQAKTDLAQEMPTSTGQTEAFAPVTPSSDANPKSAVPSSLNEAEKSSSLAQVLAYDLDKAVDMPLDLSKHFGDLKSLETQPMKNLTLACVRPRSGHAHLGTLRLERARRESRRLRFALTSIVESQKRCQSFSTDTGTRISFSKLHRIALGNMKIFEKPSLKKGIDTAVHVLLDLSGSMGLEGGETAINASLSLMYALEAIKGVNPALTVFPGRACGHPDNVCCSVLSHGETLASIDPGTVGILESFGSTPLFESLLYAGIALDATKNLGKAVIIITDDVSFREPFRNLVTEMKRSGIRLMGIQIGADATLSEVIPESCCIRSTNELKPVLERFARRLTWRQT